MINKLANKIVKHYISKNKIEKEHEEVYVYSFELLISTILNLLIVLIISLVANLIIEGIVFSVCFMILRALTGGYHSNTHLGCLLTLIIIFSLYITLYKFLDTQILYYLSISMLITSLIIPILAPVDSLNKPLTIKEYKINKKKSVLAFFIFVIVDIVLICIKSASHFAFAISYPMFIVALLLVIGLIKNKYQINKKLNTNKGEQNYEKH